MSDVEQWEHDEQRAMENEIISLREQVATLTKERNAFQDQCIRLKNERAVEKGQLATIAEQNEKMKEALLFVTRVTCLAADENPESPIFRVYKVSSDAYELPNLTTPVLNRIRAEGMRMAADLLDNPMDRAAAQKIRTRADELEKTYG